MPGTAPETLIEQINRLLPQTQCRQCDYAGCRPYAEAIAAGLADINQCPPGGDAGTAGVRDGSADGRERARATRILGGVSRRQA
mgnify:CR=1 FL=1